MKLSEIFAQMSSGELSQLSIGGNEQGVLDEKNWHQILNHVNVGLTALYRRFFLKEGRVKLRLIADRTIYPLHSDYSVLSTKNPGIVKHILDETAARFQDDILKIERVLTDSGVELSLNDLSDEYSLFTPSMFTLRVPEKIVKQGNDLPERYKTENLELVYRANHPQIVVPLGYFDPERFEVELPPSHLQALLFYVASRIHNPIGIANEFHAGNSWYARYEQECQDLENKGVQVDRDSQPDRLRAKGFV